VRPTLETRDTLHVNTPGHTRCKHTVVIGNLSQNRAMHFCASWCSPDNGSKLWTFKIC